MERSNGRGCDHGVRGMDGNGTVQLPRGVPKTDRFLENADYTDYKNHSGGEAMKFHELPQKWKTRVILLWLAAAALPILLAAEIWTTLGSMIMVMVG